MVHKKHICHGHHVPQNNRYCQTYLINKECVLGGVEVLDDDVNSPCNIARQEYAKLSDNRHLFAMQLLLVYLFELANQKMNHSDIESSHQSVP